MELQSFDDSGLELMPLIPGWRGLFWIPPGPRDIDGSEDGDSDGHDRPGKPGSKVPNLPPVMPRRVPPTAPGRTPPQPGVFLGWSV